MDQYSRFSAAENQKVWQNKGKQPISAGENTVDTSSIKELNVHIHQLSANIKIQNKCFCHIKTNNGDEELFHLGDDKTVLNLPKRDNPDLGRQWQVRAKKIKGGGLLLNPYLGLLCLKTFRTIRVGTCATLWLSVALNDLE